MRAGVPGDRRRGLAVALAAGVAAAAAAVTVVVADRDADTPSPRVARPVVQDTACGSSPRQEPAFAARDEAVVAAQREWISELAVGPPPRTPWWHDGVLHVGDADILTPFRVRAELLEVAGGIVLVGDPAWDDPAGEAEWAVVREGRLEPLPTGNSDPHLSDDGRIAYWSVGLDATPGPDAGPDPGLRPRPVVAWDVETSQQLASRELTGHVMGVDADGIAYVWDRNGDLSVTEWDVRADTLTPSDLAWDEGSFGDECSLLARILPGRLESGYVSPDGTRRLFTGPAAGDTSADCCTTRLRVRPAGPARSGNAARVTALPLPAGIPHLTLWHSYSDRGTWGVWWESDETVLLDAVVDGSSYLVRCTVDGSAACERVFELGPVIDPPPDQGPLYDPAWQSEWAFAHAPVTR